jgi:hypothetical protein
LDKDLTFSLHIKRLKGLISRIAGLFRRLKDILSFPVKRMLFFALFQSQVSYGISVWDRIYHYLIIGIQRVQNRAIKNMFGFSFLEETYDINRPSWLSQQLLGGSPTKNPLPKAIMGTILSTGARRDGHSSVIFSKTSEWPNLARVNSPEHFNL